MPKNKLILITLTLSSVLLIAGIIHSLNAQEPAEPATESPSAAQLSDPVAVVNGQPISRELFSIYAQQRQRRMGDIESPEALQSLVDELVIQELLVQKAEEQNLAQNPEVAMQLELIRRNLLATAALRSQLQEQTPTEEAIKEAYQEMTVDQEQEYKASHILVETEGKAGEIIEKLNQGADFAELAKEHSKDTSAVQGGDLGWFSPEVMVEPFSEAVTRLEKGEYTKQPVQTQFGWHVIRLEEVREATPPSIEEVRPQIVQRLQSQMISDYLEKLREQAEVEIKVE